jgi:DNA-3-methyladenine glycosylase II
VFDLLSQTQDMAPRCGLSRQKRKYLIDLSQKFLDKKIPTRKFANMGEEQIIESLTQINGVGQWTAEMFLMFVLNRPDVLPVDDLGLREAVKRAYKLRERPDAKKLKKIAEPWRPWRTVATWYLWRGMEG